MTRLEDIRALGMGAPLRAGYEASKRLGGHRVVFGGIRLRPSVAFGRTPFEFGDVPEAIRRQTLDAADRICDGRVEVFGRELDVGYEPDWHAVIDGDGHWPTDEWWKIDIRSDDRIGDVKWAWELGRHRHLVLLGRAVHLEPEKPQYAEVLNRHLASWLRSNPLEKGVHWYSNLEISLRALAWLQILALAQDALEPDVETGMWRHLRHAGRHLLADLPYTVSTMRNNHLLGDALGMIALGKAFENERMASIGDRLFINQLQRHMRPDGSMIEDSLSYHRFVLEMLSMRMVLGRAQPTVAHAAEGAAQFLARLGTLDGPVPQYGDWDEGRVFATAVDPRELEGSTLLALSLCGTGAAPGWRNDWDEVAWFTGPGYPVEPDAAGRDGHEVGAGIARVERGGTAVWLKMGSGPSHGHADLSSVAVARADQLILGDPGTATYNGDLAVRNHFRGSASHNVLRPGGREQLEAHRAFRWLTSAQGVVGEPIRASGFTIMWGVHNAYDRAGAPGRVVRFVAIADDGSVHVADMSEEACSGSLTLQFTPGVSLVPTDDPSVFRVEGTDVSVSVGGGRVGAVLSGVVKPLTGWWSSTYGSWEPADCIVVLRDAETPQSFALTTSDDGGPPPSVEVRWMDGHVALAVATRGGGAVTRTVAFG